MTDTLKYKDYIASIHFSNEDDLFYGKVIGINDLIVFHGTSVKELKREFKNAVDDYLQTCKELKKEPDKTYKGSFNIRIPSDLHRNAAFYASQQNISLNDFVRFAIETALNRELVNKQQTSNFPKAQVVTQLPNPSPVFFTNQEGKNVTMEYANTNT